MRDPIHVLKSLEEKASVEFDIKAVDDGMSGAVWV